MYVNACGVPKIITKVSNITFPGMLDKMGLDTVISPKIITTDHIIRYVRAMQNSEGSPVETLYRIANEGAEALEFIVKPGCAFTGIPLKDLELKKQILIACIVRNGKAIVPGGNTTIEAGDNVVVVTKSNTLRDFQDILE
jgi:trk system potassium uptake protein TrkA